MNEIKIDGLAKFKGINFTFASPLELKPTEKFPETELAKGKLEIASVKASADKEFPIGESGDVKFSVGGGGFAAFGVYRKKDALLKDLKAAGLSDRLAGLLNLNIADNENLLAMRWGYNFKAAAEGKVGLFASPVNLTFGVSGKTHGLSALLHAVGREKTIAESVRETLDSWTTPRQVKTLDDLKEKTTLIFETLGRLDVSVGVNYGYEFSWVRESLELGGLSGDMGLKIEMGIAARFGFHTVGNYALALSRETRETIRLQVFKMKESGMSFAFDGGFSGQLQGSLPPKTLDEFIKGVFNLNGSQVLKDFEKWTDENTSLEELLGEEIPGAVDDFVRRLTGIGATEAIDKGIKQLKDVISKWHALPHDFTSYLYGLLGRSEAADEIGKLKEFLIKAKNLSTSREKVLEEIESHLESLDFYRNPVVKWLTAFAGESALSLLPGFDNQKLKDFNGWVDKTLGLLDSDRTESTLKKLQQEIDERLHLDKIESLNPDKWLRKRLADFLGQSKIVDELEKIKKGINELRKNGEKFYKKGYEALLAKYSFSVNFAFQKATADSALIDLTFDFGKDAQKAADYLNLALDGDFRTVLTDQSLSFLKVNKAVLTHDINRSVHLAVNVPSFSRTLDHITKSQAIGELVEANGDKLWIYNLKAEDVLDKEKSRSRLALTSRLSEKSGIRTFSEEGNRLDYSFAYGKMEADSRYIEQRFEIGVTNYLRSEFPAVPDFFRKYLLDLDRQLDAKGFDKPDEFGNVLASLKVSLSGEIMSFWEDVPDAETDDFYRKLSEVVQNSFREWIPQTYIQGPEMYADEIEDDIYPLLVYSCLPALTDKQGEKQKFKRVYYWDYKKDSRRKEVLNNPDLRNKLRVALEKVRLETAVAGYSEADIPRIIDVVLNGEGKGNFKELCGFEEELLENIVETVNFYLEFRKETDPQKKIKKLGEFGAEFVDTFNDEIGHIGYTPKGSLRPLGLLLFARIAQLKKPELIQAKTASMFELMVLRDGFDKKEFAKVLARYKQGNYPSSEDRKEDVVFQQRIVNSKGLLM